MRANQELRGVIVGRFGSLGNFADVAGVHVTQLSFLLNGHRKLNVNQAKVWQAILECPKEILRPIIREA